MSPKHSPRETKPERASTVQANEGFRLGNRGKPGHQQLHCTRRPREIFSSTVGRICLQPNQVSVPNTLLVPVTYATAYKHAPRENLNIERNVRCTKLNQRAVYGLFVNLVHAVHHIYLCIPLRLSLGEAATPSQRRPAAVACPTGARTPSARRPTERT